MKFIQTVLTREILQYLVSWLLQHCVFLANLCPSYLSALKPISCEKISALNNSDFKYRLKNLLYEYKTIFEGTCALKKLKLNIHIDHSVQLCVQKSRLPFLMKKQVENEIQNLFEQTFQKLLVPKMHLKISRKLLIQTSLMTLTVCSTLPIIQLLKQKI